VSARIIDTRQGRATVLDAADFDGRGLINLRGRASMRYPKRSYTLKTVDELEDPWTTSILGMPKESDWILYAPYPDKTLVRDVLAYELSNQIGRWAPRTRFVELFLSESGDRISRRDYMGVYVFEEKIKRDKNRVNVANLGPEDNTEPALTGGYIFKKDHSDSGDIDQMFQREITAYRFPGTRRTRPAVRSAMSATIPYPWRGSADTAMSTRKSTGFSGKKSSGAPSLFAISTSLTSEALRSRFQCAKNQYTVIKHRRKFRMLFVLDPPKWPGLPWPAGSPAVAPYCSAGGRTSLLPPIGVRRNDPNREGAPSPPSRAGRGCSDDRVLRRR
jgi:hypothetical protein